jgi:ASC-1-like (ASCH) protein
MEIHKKVLPEYFEALLSGEKKYELRLNEEEYKDVKPGDVLVLEEWTSLDTDSRKATGRSVRKTISYLRTFTLDELAKFWSREDIEKKGFIIFSLAD